MTTETLDAAGALRWEPVCPVSRLLPDRGVAALLAHAAGPVQVAVFRLSDGTLHAVGNIDPIAGAAVLSRGIVGDRAGVSVVASPIYKQAFSLATGQCLDQPDVSVPVYPVRVVDDLVQVGLP